MITLAVNGAQGRMGSRILSLAYQSSEDFKIVAAFEQPGNKELGKDIGGLLGLGRDLKVKLAFLSGARLRGVQVLIDFSSPAGAEAAVEASLKARTALVVGTTGMGAALEKKIGEASRHIAVVCSPNMSIGANFLFELARLSAARLREGYDIEIIEKHHRLKKDAPSGTAKKIAQIIAKEKGWDLPKVARFGRQGMVGERLKDELGIHVVRAGDIVGEHTVLFSGLGESIEITHCAQSRDAFARGALVAALFISKKKAGLYSMSDVLGLR